MTNYEREALSMIMHRLRYPDGCGGEEWWARWEHIQKALLKPAPRKRRLHRRRGLSFRESRDLRRVVEVLDALLAAAQKTQAESPDAPAKP